MCAVCGSTENISYEKENLLLCKQCGFVWEPLDTVNTSQYDETYYDKYLTYPLQELAKIRADYVEEKLPPLHSVADIGFGTGAFLKEMYSRGYETYGREVISKAWETAPRHIQEYTNQTVDIITFFDSLEHIPNINAYMTTLSCKYVVISVPNFKGIQNIQKWTHYRPGEHIYYFNFQTLTKFMTKHGYVYISSGFPEDEIRRTEPQNILTAIYRNV
jgi:SAM-dependent methyltransferase